MYIINSTSQYHVIRNRVLKYKVGLEKGSNDIGSAVSETVYIIDLSLCRYFF